jgi:hypothetical protein
MILGKPKSAPNGEERYCCPFCLRNVGKVDHDYHLYVNRSVVEHGIRGWFTCKRCGVKGPAHKLFGDNSQVEIPASKWSEFIHATKFGKPTAHETRAKEVGLPKDYEPVFQGTRAYDYLRERGITDHQISYYKIGFGSADLRKLDREEQNKFAGSGRIIFPNYDESGKVNYWVARTYVNHKVRYKNPRNTDAGKVIYNLANAVQYEEVVITEGVISAIRAGKNAVATFGKNVTDAQVSLLVESAFSRYVVALDGDAGREAVQLARQLTRRNCDVRLVKFAYHEDPASAPRAAELILGALPINSATFFKLIANRP